MSVEQKLSVANQMVKVFAATGSSRRSVFESFAGTLQARNECWLIFFVAFNGVNLINLRERSLIAPLSPRGSPAAALAPLPRCRRPCGLAIVVTLYDISTFLHFFVILCIYICMFIPLPHGHRQRTLHVSDFTLVMFADDRLHIRLHYLQVATRWRALRHLTWR